MRNHLITTGPRSLRGTERARDADCENVRGRLQSSAHAAFEQRCHGALTHSESDAESVDHVRDHAARSAGREGGRSTRSGVRPRGHAAVRVSGDGEEVEVADRVREERVSVDQTVRDRRVEC